MIQNINVIHKRKQEFSRENEIVVATKSD